jgi:hypothetical protein
MIALWLVICLNVQKLMKFFLQVMSISRLFLQSAIVLLSDRTCSVVCFCQPETVNMNVTGWSLLLTQSILTTLEYSLLMFVALSEICGFRHVIQRNDPIVEGLLHWIFAHTFKGNSEEGTTEVPFCHYLLGLYSHSFHICEQDLLSSIYGGSYDTFPVIVSPGCAAIKSCLEQTFFKIPSIEFDICDVGRNTSE